jgi:hypothetical protein
MGATAFRKRATLAGSFSSVSPARISHVRCDRRRLRLERVEHRRDDRVIDVLVAEPERVAERVRRRSRDADRLLGSPILAIAEADRLRGRRRGG